MQYPISVGLDVHKNSISACAVDVETGEVKKRRFGYDAPSLIGWLGGFDKPLCCVYESGFCGFHLKRELEAANIACIIAAISKLAKPAGDKIKTDKRDAEFLARQLAARNIPGIWVPDIEMEGMRDVARSYEAASDALKVAKQRLGAMCLRYGLRYDKTKTLNTKTYDGWLRVQKMPTDAAQSAFDSLLCQYDALCAQKQRIALEIENYCKTERFKPTVDALCLLISIRAISAFRLITEVGDFKRFKTARAFASHIGLVPSESSSGQSTRRGHITKCGNTHIRKLLVELSWSIARAKNAAKKESGNLSDAVIAHAKKGNRRMMRKRQAMRVRNKNANIANVASARELSMWVWAMAVMI
jgi:transposase